MISDDLSTQRDAAAQRVEDLRDQRAAAALDGLEFDDSLLVAAERELDRIADAEGLRARRSREATAQALQAQRAATRLKMAKSVKRYLAAIDSAEKASREMAIALKQVREHAEELNQQATVLGIGSPAALHGNTLEERLSRRMSVAMRPLTGHTNRYGPLNWPPPPDPAAHWFGSWIDAERAILKRSLPDEV
ncbi:hypothetical protein [Mesorhizobium australicum]|uniref:Uncharacterized protein n=1 Tax=Mesorhizobium australicum TaxID=536018 RepID=A0A1X7NEB1_9HYPH|nr:hypothetical protein [Mesorhizobium australicum]SMH36075.1 hypothetical protein SAMN02982922_1687 [Mesorhizobium australicum]